MASSGGLGRTNLDLQILLKIGRPTVRPVLDRPLCSVISKVGEQRSQRAIAFVLPGSKSIDRPPSTWSTWPVM